MSTNPTIKYEVSSDNIALLTLNRPKSANALDTAMATEIKDFFINLPETVRVVIITGEGDRAFCAGADLKERLGIDIEAWQTQHQIFRHALQLLRECRVPVIAAVNGAAFGGGLEIALACDFIYASSNAKFALPETTLGIIPGLGGTQNLPRAIGLRRAKELLFSGKPFSVEHAYQWGMVNRICKPEELLRDAMACAQNIVSNAPLAVIAAKRAATQGIDMPLDSAIVTESDSYNGLLGSEDRHEGINAYNEKRAASFVGK